MTQERHSLMFSFYLSDCKGLSKSVACCFPSYVSFSLQSSSNVSAYIVSPVK